MKSEKGTQLYKEHEILYDGQPKDEDEYFIILHDSMGRFYYSYAVFENGEWLNVNPNFKVTHFLERLPEQQTEEDRWVKDVALRFGEWIQDEKLTHLGEGIWFHKGAPKTGEEIYQSFLSTPPNQTDKK